MPKQLFEGDANEAEYWERHYREGNLAWDLGAPAPPFVDLLDGAGAPQPGRMLVLGAGRGHDAVLFAGRGFDVTAVDFAPGAVAETTQAAREANVPVEAVQHDIFAMPPDFAHRFDYVLEHTCFCAIDPTRREEYVRVVWQMLQPGGLFIALFFTHGRPGGPPFTTSEGEIRRLFEPYFSIEQVETPRRSVKPRQGLELLALMRPQEDTAVG